MITKASMVYISKILKLLILEEYLIEIVKGCLMRKYFRKNLIKNENGQALVQIVILFIPVLLVILSMMTDLWRVFDAKLLVQSAASECAINMVEKSDDPEGVEKYVRHVIYTEYGNRLKADKVKFKMTPTGTEYEEKYKYHSNLEHEGIETSNKFRDMKIEVSYDVDLVLPLTKEIFGSNTVNVKSSFITRVSKK